MAAPPRMTAQEWAAAQAAWESDVRDGFEWLVRELGLPVSGNAVRKRSKQLGAEWVKAPPGVRAENAPQGDAASAQKYKRSVSRARATGEPEGGEKSPPDGFEAAPDSAPKLRTRRMFKKSPSNLVIDMDTGAPAQGSQGSHGSQGSQGSPGQKWRMNLGDSEELWRRTTPIVAPADDDEPRGRPTVYQKIFAHQAFTFCLTGATNEGLATLFQVTRRTITRWMKEHKEFCHAVMAGREGADAQVAMSLYKRAVGMTVPKAHVSSYKGLITVTELEEYIPPDVGAASLWLFNRQPDKWRAQVEAPQAEESSLTPFDEELDAVYEASMRASAQAAEAAREERRRSGIFGKRPELDSLESDDDGQDLLMGIDD